MASVSLTYIAGDKAKTTKHEKELKLTDKGFCPCGLKVIRQKKSRFSNTWVNTGEVCDICEAKGKLNQGEEVKVQEVKAVEPTELEVQYVVTKDPTNNDETCEEEKAFLEYFHSYKKTSDQALKQEKEAHQVTQTLLDIEKEQHLDCLKELKKEKETNNTNKNKIQNYQKKNKELQAIRSSQEEVLQKQKKAHDITSKLLNKEIEEHKKEKTIRSSQEEEFQKKNKELQAAADRIVLGLDEEKEAHQITKRHLEEEKETNNTNKDKILSYQKENKELQAIRSSQEEELVKEKKALETTKKQLDLSETRRKRDEEELKTHQDLIRSYEEQLKTIQNTLIKPIQDTLTKQDTLFKPKTLPLACLPLEYLEMYTKIDNTNISLLDTPNDITGKNKLSDYIAHIDELLASNYDINSSILIKKWCFLEFVYDQLTQEKEDKIKHLWIYNGKRYRKIECCSASWRAGPLRPDEGYQKCENENDGCRRLEARYKYIDKLDIKISKPILHQLIKQLKKENGESDTAAVEEEYLEMYTKIDNTNISLLDTPNDITGKNKLSDYIAHIDELLASNYDINSSILIKKWCFLEFVYDQLTQEKEDKKKHLWVYNNKRFRKIEFLSDNYDINEGYQKCENENDACKRLETRYKYINKMNIEISKPTLRQMIQQLKKENGESDIDVENADPKKTTYTANSDDREWLVIAALAAASRELDATMKAATASNTSLNAMAKKQLEQQIEAMKNPAASAESAL